MPEEITLYCVSCGDEFSTEVWVDALRVRCDKCIREQPEYFCPDSDEDHGASYWRFEDKLPRKKARKPRPISMWRKIQLSEAAFAPAGLAKLWREMRWMIRYLFLGDLREEDWETSYFGEKTRPSKFWIALQLVIVLAIGSTYIALGVAFVVGVTVAVILFLERWVW